MVDIRPNKEEAWWKEGRQVLKCGLGVKPSKFDLAQRGIILKKVGPASLEMKMGITGDGGIGRQSH